MSAEPVHEGEYCSVHVTLTEAFTREQAMLQPPGHFISWRQADGSLSVLQADPRIWITGTLLAIMHDGTAPGVSYECAGVSDCPYGDVIRIDADGRRFVYVVGPEAVYEPPTFTAAWPD